MFGQRRSHAVRLCDIQISHHVQLQQARRAQLPVQRFHRRYHHPFLHRGDATPRIAVLRAQICAHQVLRRRHWNAALAIQKSGLFHVARHLSVRDLHHAALRHRCIRRDSQPFQRKRVQNTRMAGLVSHNHRIVGSGTVQHFSARRTFFPKNVMVETLSGDPLPL